MNCGYPKEEKLKSRNAIDELFRSGKSVSIYPLRLVYRKSSDEREKLQFGVSVSKRNFKKAVDRNYIKRVLREAYRLNKPGLDGASAFDFMLIYQTKERIPFDELKSKTRELFEKFASKELNTK